ncbi:MAG: HDOD domain-containing protein [Desulfovibrio sp.]|uniref:HDOD domain-containing protein n=1 Tax=Desulfovibrio sp. 7SRBS1 TaxID=3378064 RepID=UPI003B3EEC71
MINPTLASLKVNLHNTFPPVMYRLLSEAVKDQPDFPTIAETIGMDPALAASVLNLVNSPFYGLSQKVVALRRAAVVLGVQEILKLALSVSFHQNAGKEGVQNERSYSNWRMLVWASVATELIAETHCPSEASRLYLCALLKDLSLIVLQKTCPEQFNSMAQPPLLCPIPGQLRAEEKMFGVDHAELSMELLNELGLMGLGCDCVPHHHDIEGIINHPPATQCLILATRWSEVELGCSRDPQQILHFEAICRRIMNLDQDAMDELRSNIVMRFSSMLSTLGIAEAPQDSHYYRHSLYEIQRANFLASEISNPAGGLPSISGLLHRILSMTFSLMDWELALLGPDKQLWYIFSCTDGELSDQFQKSSASDEIAWQHKGEEILIQASGETYGKLNIISKPENYSPSGLCLQLKFVAHALENYLLRRAQLETKASTLDQLPIGVARLDPQGKIQDANAQYIKYFRLPPNYKGTSLELAVSRVTEENSPGTLRSFLAGNQKNVSRIFCIKDKEGADQLLYASLHRSDGSSDTILSLTEDLSDVSSLEVQSIKQLGFLNALVSSMRDIVLTLDETGRITYASPNAPQILLGKNLFDVARSTSKAAPLPGKGHLAEMSGPYEVKIDLPDKQIPLELIFSPMQAKDQKSNYLMVGRDLTTIRRLEEELRRKAVYDGLTGLLNHSQFQTLLERELRRAERTGKRVGLIFLDLDGFKAINDTQGHLAGDAVLRKVGRILRGACRKGSMDFPCRYGGDEFAVIYTEVDEHLLETAFARIRKGFEAELSGKVGFSAGLALAEIGETTTDLLHRTDKATYRAKEAEGTQFRWADCQDRK